VPVGRLVGSDEPGVFALVDVRLVHFGRRSINTRLFATSRTARLSTRSSTVPARLSLWSTGAPSFVPVAGRRDDDDCRRAYSRLTRLIARAIPRYYLARRLVAFVTRASTPSCSDAGGKYQGVAPRTARASASTLADRGAACSLVVRPLDSRHVNVTVVGRADQFAT